MAKRLTHTAASLLDHFEPPEGYQGQFGFICGFSADEYFMQEALTRFTTQMPGTRAFEGKARMLLLLDKTNPPILWEKVPGLVSLHPIHTKNRYRLMHAKVALLHYTNETQNDSILRLIVSTGNWTTGSLHSLDIAARFDMLLLNKGAVLTTENRQANADIYSAWGFFEWLLLSYDSKILDTGLKGAAHYIDFIKLGKSLKAPRGIRTRFFDNRSHSLLKQIPEMISSQNGDGARNHLFIGSGFFQQHTKKKRPCVIDEIDDVLKNNGLLTKNASKRIYVNPDACQDIAGFAKHLDEKGYDICATEDPIDNMGRSLHAKFIFGFNMRDGAEKVTGSWLYFGSGNMTEAGFLNRAGANSGNVEAGVILMPGDLHWYKVIKSCQPIVNLLPIQQEAVPLQPHELRSGPAYDKTVEYFAPPVSWFEWLPDEANGGSLAPGYDTDVPYEVIATDGTVCKKNDGGSWTWEDQLPTQVKIRWQDHGTNTYIVPVADAFGYFNRKPWKLSFEDAAEYLKVFPGVIDEDTPNDTEENAEDDETGMVKRKSKTRTGTYPIRSMMHTLELIATQQCGLSRNQWTSWCDKLEQIFLATKDSPVYELFNEMKINPLSPLRQKCFRPEFAEDSSTTEGQLYEAALNNITENLKLKNLTPL